MSAATTKPAASKRRRVPSQIVWLAAGILAVAAAWWALDGYLYFRLQMIVEETFSSGSQLRSASLVVANKAELDGYSPKRLARFLSLASARLKVVVLLSMADRPLDDSKEWVGVAPRLLKTCNEDSDEIVRTKAMWTLAAMPFVPTEDVIQVVDWVERADDRPTDVRSAILEVAAKSNPEMLDRTTAELRRWIDRKDSLDRSLAFKQLVKLAPMSAEVDDAMRMLTAASSNASLGDPALRPFEDYKDGQSIRDLLRVRPKLLDDLLAGDDWQRGIALAVAEGEFRPDAVGITREDLQRRFSTRRLAALRQIADRAINDQTIDGDDPRFARAVRFFGWTQPDGPQMVFDMAVRMGGARRREAFSVALWAVKQRPDAEIEQFLSARLDQIIKWLMDDDAALQSRIIGLFADGQFGKWMRRHRTGPQSPIVEACRKFLDHFPNREDVSCMSIISRSAEDVLVADADRLSLAFERELGRWAISFAERPPEGRTSDTLPLDLRRLLYQLRRHSNVRSAGRLLELHAKLQKEGVLSGGADRNFRQR